MKVNPNPDGCVPGDLTHKDGVADWQPLTNRQAVNFRRHTGKKLAPDSILVRKGSLIFEVGDADLALCVYAHTFTFD